MRKIMLALTAATALVGATAANAAITIDGHSIGDISVGSPDNSTMPETVKFDTSTDTAGTLTPWFEFSNDLAGQYFFSVTTSTGAFNGSTISLEVLTDSGFSTVATSMGTGITLDMLTPILQAGETYRFTYTFNAGEGGGVASGNASFMTAVPEPATWAMMLIGFGGIGFTMRRRRTGMALAQIA